jgi:hypothetical protein
MISSTTILPGCAVRPRRREPARKDLGMNFCNPNGPRFLGVIISPSARPGYFTARLTDGRELVTSSRHPVLDAARVLLGEGCDPATILISRHAGTGTVSLRAPIGDAAKLTVAEGALDPPRFRLWKPFISREGSPRTRQNEQAAIHGQSVDFSASVTAPPGLAS